MLFGKRRGEVSSLSLNFSDLMILSFRVSVLQIFIYFVIEGAFPTQILTCFKQDRQTLLSNW